MESQYLSISKSPLLGALLLLLLIAILSLSVMHFHIQLGSNESTSKLNSLNNGSNRKNRPGLRRNMAIDMQEVAALSELNSTLHKLREELLALTSVSSKLKSSPEQSHRSAILLPNNDRAIVENPNLNRQIKVAVSNKITEEKQSSVIDLIPKTQGNKRNALIFTMDCMPSYEEGSTSGGASGELTIRYSLQDAFNAMGITLRTIRSDKEFDSTNMKEYDIILLDSWTWAAKGWVPKRNIIGHEARVYILDFFGANALRGGAYALKIPLSHILTAFKSPWNSFLGYYIPDSRIEHGAGQNKQRQGIVWGKDPKHYDGKDNILKAAANKAKLISTASHPISHIYNLEWHGHQTSEQWLDLLAKSNFLLGLGNPLLGPSAVDAVSLGCMFINPIYKEPVLAARYDSQHPYIASVAADYVCSYHEGNTQELEACIDRALKANLEPRIPEELTKAAYFKRVQQIFEL